MPNIAPETRQTTIYSNTACFLVVVVCVMVIVFAAPKDNQLARDALILLVGFGTTFGKNLSTVVDYLFGGSAKPEEGES